VSTVEKYQAAEAASEAGTKPSVTAGLFKKAQNEAAIEAEEEKVLKAFVEGM
jgi:predicted metal-dependent phosphotriesterase family hydrolase